MIHNRRHILGILLVLIALGCARPEAARGNPKLAEKELKTLIRRVKPAYVFFSQGSGVIVSSDGLVLTNSHVLIKPGRVFKVRLGSGEAYEAILLGRDRYGDLALLKLKNAANLAHLKLADAKKVKAGQPCLALGNPFAVGLVDQTPTVTYGVVSGLHQLHGRYTDAIVTDVPINPGNSGGPLVNLSGELIGINGKIESRLGLRSNTGLAFAIPANQIKLFLPVMKAAQGGDVYHGTIHGLYLEDDELLQGSGAKIVRVARHTDAAESGFRAGDIVTAINGDRVWSVQRYKGIIGTYPGGSEVNVTIKREDKDKPVVVKAKLKPVRLGKLYFTLREARRGDKYLVIDEVEANSPASRQGLKAGDEIMMILGRSMSQLSLSLQYLVLQDVAVKELRPGSKVILKVRRKQGDMYVEKIISYNAG